MKTKLVAMFLPQYHEIEENNRWWGKGFTDWVSARNAKPLFEGHNQPKIPQNNNYYDLSNPKTLSWQAKLAKEHGVDAFCFYHYWFSTEQKLLTKPAENFLSDNSIDIEFMFAWDNASWIRTWSKFKQNANAWTPLIDGNNTETLNDEQSGVLAELKYGDENDWKIHFDYLLPFFSDKRYIKIDKKPVFILWNKPNANSSILLRMKDYWNELAQKAGFDGMYFISRDIPYRKSMVGDVLFNYEPEYSGWKNRNLLIKIYRKIIKEISKKKKLGLLDYDKVWHKILRYAKKHKNGLYGCFVNYDDTPRRGEAGKVIINGTPDKFKNYLNQLYDISCKRNKELLFITAWNEWGEGAYLEPDLIDGYAYLEAIKFIKDNY